MKRNLTQKINIRYALMQGFYWSAYCAVCSNAAFFLQSTGFSNTATGLIIGCGSFLSFLLSVFISPIVDEGRKLTASNVILSFLVLEFLFGVSLYFLVGNGPLITLLCVLWIGVMSLFEAMCTQVSVDINHAGFRLDFGTGRAFGSFLYIFTSVILGKILETNSYQILIIAALILEALFFLATLLTDSLLRDGEKTEISGYEKPKSMTLREFSNSYRSFLLLLFGIWIIFIGESVVAEFLINIVTELGGDASDVGYINAFYALLEIPGMLLWRKISGKRWETAVLMLSISMYIVRCIFFAFVGSVPAIYPGALFHCLGYGIYTPAMVAYINKRIPYEDSAKAQSLAAAMATLGIVCSSALCGTLLDRISVQNTLLITACITSIGAGICYYAILSHKRKKDSRTTPNE